MIQSLSYKKIYNQNINLYKTTYKEFKILLIYCIDRYLLDKLSNIYYIVKIF